MDPRHKAAADLVLARRDAGAEAEDQSEMPQLLAPAMQLKHDGFGMDIIRVMRKPGHLPMYKHCVPRIPADTLEAVLRSRRVQTAVVRIARQRGVAESVVRKEAKGIAATMGHNLGTNAIRLMGYMLHKVLSAVYQEVRVDQAELDAVKEAVKNGPVLILPNHRSYMDFLIVSYIFFFADVPVPAIAAGADFLSLGPVTWLLRRCGAFFMRRSFKEDPLYWACFSEYVQEIVGNGDQPLEFFIEGTRSRVGKSLHPKVGLMGAALRPFFEGRVAEINILPIAVTYEERMETHLYADEMLGTPKPKESFGKVYKARSVMEHNHGRMHVKLGPIISAQKFLENRVSRARHTLSPGPTPFNADDKAAVVDLSYEVIKAHQRGFVVTVPVILGALTLSWHLSGRVDVPTAQAIEEMRAIYHEVVARGYSIDVVPRVRHEPVSTVADALGAGLESWMTPLAPAVDFDGSRLHMNLGADHPPFNGVLLAHLRNEMLHVFAVEALVLASTLCAIDTGVDATAEAVYQQFIFLHKLVYKEVILRYANDGERRAAFDDGVAKLLRSSQISQGAHGGFQTVLGTSNGALGMLMLSLVSSYIEAYHNALVWSVSHISGVQNSEAVTQLRAATAQQRPDLPADCQSQDTIKNAFATFSDMGIISTNVATGVMDLRSDHDVPGLLSKMARICTSIRKPSGRSAVAALVARL